jgi:hypothetical protein
MFRWIQAVSEVTMNEIHQKNEKVAADERLSLMLGGMARAKERECLSALMREDAKTSHST